MKRLRAIARGARKGYIMDAVALAIFTAFWAVYCHMRPRRHLYKRPPNAEHRGPNA